MVVENGNSYTDMDGYGLVWKKEIVKYRIKNGMLKKKKRFNSGSLNR